MRSLDALVEHVAATLGCGVSLEDLDGLLLAYSSNQEGADPVRVQFLLAKHVPAEVAAWQRSHGIEEAVRPVVVEANPDLLMSERICVPLLERGYRVGYLWTQVPEDRPAAQVLEAMAGCGAALQSMAQLILDTNTGQTEHRRAKESVFLAAARGQKRGRAQLADWPELHATGPWVLGAMTLIQDAAPIPGSQNGARTPSSSTAPAQRDAVRLGIRIPADPEDSALVHRTSALSGSLGIAHALFSAGAASHALMLYSAAATEETRQKVLSAYEHEAAGHGSALGARAVAGLSEPFSTVAGLAQAHTQALTALQAASAEPGMGREAAYRDIGVYQFIAGASRGAVGEHPPSIHYERLLAEPDGPELLQILESLYERSGSVAQVAAELHMHRSSVYNKLTRIRALVGGDPLSGPVRLELHLALKLARWERRPRLQ